MYHALSIHPVYTKKQSPICRFNLKIFVILSNRPQTGMASKQAGGWLLSVRGGAWAKMNIDF